MNQKNILIILGHPNEKSLNKEIADTYFINSKNSGFNVKRIYLYDKKFDPILHKGYNGEQKLETDLKSSQKEIKWADHIVFIYPIWWGTMPSLLKGFVDRVFLPGFAFQYKNNSMIPKRFLKNKTSRIITTSGMPGFLFWFTNQDRKLIKRFFLNFVGIKPVRCTNFGSAEDISKKRFLKIKNKTEKLARKGK